MIGGIVPGMTPLPESSPHPPHALGRWGESYAARYLERRGWTILAQNYRFGRREVDLVVTRDGVVVFVEVKTRASDGYGSPLEAITWKKRREIEAVARHFLASQDFGEADVRFDAVAVTRRSGSRVIRIDHVQDAWRPDA